jgi:hypothetical protein
VTARKVVTSQRHRNVPDVVTHRYGNSNMAAQTTTWPPELYYNIYCLDVFTSISVMVRMIKTTHFFDIHFNIIFLISSIFRVVSFAKEVHVVNNNVKRTE